eukprot:6201451-Pleurochrysis_carterae.AAC.1
MHAVCASIGSDAIDHTPHTAECAWYLERLKTCFTSCLARGWPTQKKAIAVSCTGEGSAHNFAHDRLHTQSTMGTRYGLHPKKRY